MSDFLQTCLTFPTLLYSIVLAFCAIYWLLASTGLVDTDAIDGMLAGDAHAHVHVAHDLHHHHGDGGDHATSAGMLARLGLSGVPIMVVLTVLSFFGWLGTYFVHLLVLSHLPAALRLLLGTDLVKDTTRLVAAYDDSAGVTARFNRNVLAVVNRELDADFDLDRFEHVARWNTEHERIEMWLRSVAAQRIQIRELDLSVEFEAGEEMLTEVSCKFRHEGVAAELAAAGLRQTEWWTDPAGDFGLSLAVKPDPRT